MRARVIGLAAVAATACTRRVPVATTQGPTASAGDAAAVSSIPTESRDAGATWACSAVTRFERECLRNGFGALHTGYIVTERPRLAIHPIPRSQLHRLEVGIEALPDAGVIASYAQTVDPGGDAYMTRIAEEAATDGMNRFLEWCFATGSVALARSKIAVESSPGGFDAGARVVESVPIAWLRDGVIPQTPLCREEADWARVRAEALKDGATDAGTLTLLRVTNGGCADLTLRRSNQPEMLADGGRLPPELDVGVTMEIAPVRPQGSVIFNWSADEVIVRWSGRTASAETKLARTGELSETADVDCAGTACNVTLGCRGPLSRFPDIGLRFQFSTDDPSLDASAADAAP